MGNQGQLYFGLYLTSDTLLMAIVLLSAFLILAITISMMRIYKKAGKPSISAIIPIWSQINLFQIVGKPWWYLFLLLIPIVNIVIMIQTYILLAKRFGKGAGFGVGMIFLPMIFIPLLSFYDYVGRENSEELNEEQPVYNPFNQTNVEQVMPEVPIQSVNSFEQVPEIVDNKEISENEVNNTLYEQPEVLKTNVEQIEPMIVQESEYVINEAIPTSIETEQPIVEPDIKTEEVINEIPEVMPIPAMIQDVPAISPDLFVEDVKQNDMVVENPTIQDIQDALNVNKQPVDVAFNSVPIVEEQKEDIVETLETVEVEVNSENLVNQDEIIEMPEIAAKICPACGVSLAENINFCTSCGTRL